MSGNEIWLKVKAQFQDFASAGLRKLSATTAATAKAMRGLFAGLGIGFDSLGGSVGKLLGGISGVFQAFRMMGPAAAGVAALSKAVDWLVERWAAAKKAAIEAMQAMIAAMGERVRARLAAVKQSIMDALAASLAKATTEAQRTAKAFDTLAASYLKVARAKDATAAAGDTAELAALRQSKAEAMERAGSEGDAAKAGAEYDIKIAEAAAKASAARMATAVERAVTESTDAGIRADIAHQTEEAAKAALSRAKEELPSAKEYTEMSGSDDWERKIRGEIEKAEAALFNATQARIAADAEATAAAEKVTQAQLAEAAAASDSAAAISQARKARADILAAEKKAAQAEIDRQKKEAERRAAAQERLDRQKEADAARERLGVAQDAMRAQQQKVNDAAGNVANAWRLYRSPEAMRAQLNEERAEQRARTRFEWQAAELQRRSDWRTATLGARSEAVRRVLLAREAEQREKEKLEQMKRNVEISKNNLTAILETLRNDVAL